MPPEQWNAKDVDARADIYSLGVVAYQMLTGQLPHKADNFAELLVLQQTQLPRPASQLVANVPPAADTVLERAMHRDAAQRFERSSDFVAALANATGLAHALFVPSGMIAAPSGSIAVPKARSRRTPWLAIAAGGLAVAIGAVTIAAWPSEPATAASTPVAPAPVASTPNAATPLAAPPPAVTPPAATSPTPSAAVAAPSPVTAPPESTVSTSSTPPPAVPGTRKPVRAKSKRPKHAPATKTNGDVVEDMAVPL
jgi:serine/threonine-protein kinase